MAEKKALTPEQVEEIYNIPRQTLANWRKQKIGPAYSKPGKRVLYRVKDIEDYLDRTRQQTSDHLFA